MFGSKLPRITASQGLAEGIVYLLVSALVCAVLAAGCKKANDADGGAEAANGPRSTSSYGPGEGPDAMRVLRDMVAAYRSADAYADAGRIHLRFERGSEKVDETADFSMILARPDRVRIDCYQAHLVSDGRQLRAVIDDLSGQVLASSAEGEVDLANLLADPVLAGVLTGGIAGTMPQLGLLLAEDPLAGLLAGAKEPTLLEPATHDSHPCHRVLLERTDGQLVLWIDQQHLLLRRVDYPVAELRRQLGGEDQVAGLKLWAEFDEARFASSVHEAAFRFQAPAEAKLVDRFELHSSQPEPPAPSPLLGKPVPEFEFVTLDDQPLRAADLEGKVVVLDFWATWCGPCRQSLPLLQQVYEKYHDNPDVQFFVVSIDRSDVESAKLRATLDELGVDIPVVRDPAQFARDAFQVEGIPCLYVLGPDAIVEDNEIGVNPHLADELPARLERLLAGESIYEETLRRYEQKRTEYEQSLESQASDSAATGQPAGPAEILPRTEPQRLELTRLWTNRDVSRPGNLLLVGTPEAPQLFILDGWRRVAQLDLDGNLIEAKELDIPSNAIISSLRGAVIGADQLIFVGSASTQPKVHVFDSLWQTAFSHPSDESSEIAEVELDDLDRDGRPEFYIAFWGNRGVQRVDLDGNSEWKYEQLQNVFSIATLPASDGPGEIVCANARGNLVVLSSTDGRRVREINVPGRFVRAIYASDLNDDETPELCGLSPSPRGNDVAVGIADDGKVLWTYELPAGLHQQPIEMVASADWQFGGSGVWVIAGADGSLHFLSSDGTLIDRFNYGEALTGMAVTGRNGQSVLLVASAKGVDAWQVSLR